MSSPVYICSPYSTYVYYMSLVFTIYHLCLLYKTSAQHLISGWDIFTICHICQTFKWKKGQQGKRTYVISGRNIFSINHLCSSCHFWITYLHHMLPILIMSPIFPKSHILFTNVHHMSDMFTICHLCLTYLHHMSAMFKIWHLCSSFIILGWDMFTMCHIVSLYVIYVHHMPSQLTCAHHMFTIIHIYLTYVNHMSPIFIIC